MPDDPGGTSNKKKARLRDSQPIEFTMSPHAVPLSQSGELRGNVSPTTVSAEAPGLVFKPGQMRKMGECWEVFSGRHWHPHKKYADAKNFAQNILSMHSSGSAALEG